MPRHRISARIDPGVTATVDALWLRNVALSALERQDLPRSAELSLLLTTDEEVRRLNREHRGIDRPTDVLSFSLVEGEPVPQAPAAGSMLLGDVVVSYPQAVRQAGEYGHSIEREVAFLSVHGVLHLLGYDHQDPEEEAKMVARQNETLESLGHTRG